MAHLVMAAIPAPGHVNPGLAILQRLVENGHRVSYVNDPSFRDVVEGTGAVLVPYRSVLPATNHAGAEQGGATWDGDAIDHLTRFQDEYEAMLPAVREAFTADPPDLVLYDIAGTPARLVAEARGIPTLQLSPSFVAWDGIDDDWAEFHTLIRTDPRGVALLDRQRAMLADHGVTADPLRHLGMPTRGLVLIPESLQPHAEKVDRDVFTFVGPALRRTDADASWTPPSDRRTLLVSLGSAFTRRPEFYRRCLDAFGDLPGWHLVLQIGRQVTVDEVTGGRPVPEHVELLPWVPQLEILHHADAFVTHAGMGGSNEGLATGTPMIAVPQEVDQFANADALVDVGVAVRLDSAAASVAELRDALATVTDPAVVRRSLAIADDIARAGGTDRAVALIEALLPG